MDDLLKPLHVDTWDGMSEDAKEILRNRHDVLWKFIKLIFPGASGYLGPSVTEVLGILEARSKMHSTMMADIVRRATATQEQKGFPTPRSVEERGELLAKLMLVTTELAEAAEELRRHEPRRDEFLKELADVIIRTAAIAGGLADPAFFAGLIDAKLTYNEGRDFKHGKAI